MSLRNRYLRLGAALACSIASSLAISTINAASPDSGTPPAGAHGMVKHLAATLGLDATQTASIQSVFDSQVKPALQQIHANARASAKPIMDGVMQQIQTKLSPALTSEQQQDLASLQRQHAARMAAAGTGPGMGGHRHFSHFRGAQGKFDPAGHLASALGLTDAQKTQVQGFFDAAKPQLKAIHQDARTQTQALMSKFHSQIAQYLTPQQQQDLNSMQRIQERIRAAREASKSSS
jgi:Spy/CpxP family protein refolding chaperone